MSNPLARGKITFLLYGIMSFTRTLEPPYYAVIFTTMRVNDPNDGYAEMSERLEKMVCDQPGYIGMESVRGNNGFGITVCYWIDEASITNWKNNLEHQDAQEKGRADWYKNYFLRIAKVERDNETI